jgi:hypothetical protein
LHPYLLERGKPMKQRYVWAPVALMIAANALVAAANPAEAQAALPADTVLRVQLNNTIGSDRSRPGDRFTATAEDPSLPSGTLVRGVVTGVQPADRETPGRLAVDFQTLELPSGRRVPIAGTPTTLDSKSVRTSPSGGPVATSHGKANSGKYIGYGAAGGLLIGSLLGKNVVGGLLGAGAGYLFGKHEAKKAESRNVVLKQGTELGVRLDQPVMLAGS